MSLLPRKLATRLGLVVAGGLLLSLGIATGLYLADREKAVATTVQSGAQACLTVLSGSLLSQPAEKRAELLQSWTKAGVGLSVRRAPPGLDPSLNGPPRNGPPGQEPPEVEQAENGDRQPPPLGQRPPLPGFGGRPGQPPVQFNERPPRGRPPPGDPLGLGPMGGGPRGDPFNLGAENFSSPQNPPDTDRGNLYVSQTLPDGSALVLPARWPAGMAPLDLSVWLALSLVGLTAMLLSLWAVRRALAPLDNLASAADAISGDLSAAPLPETGPVELARTAAAFNRLLDRLRRAVSGRSRVFAALSHDLRTPLTRLRLRAEMIDDDEQRQRTLADLDEMQGLVQSALSYARDQAVVETPGPVDLGAMLSGLAGGMKSLGKSVDYQGPSTASLIAGPVSLQRIFGNLVENAVRHAGNARIRMSVDDKLITVTVEDDGPGIPESELKKVLEPFYRLEPSRNRDTGGAGLGLAVVDELVRGLGGSLTLSNHQPHGLLVTIRLPRQR